MSTDATRNGTLDRILTEHLGLRTPANRIRFGYWSNNLLQVGFGWIAMAPFMGLAAIVGMSKDAGTTVAVVSGSIISLLLFVAGLVCLGIRARAYAEADLENEVFRVQTWRSSFEANIHDMEFDLPANPSLVPAPVLYRTRATHWKRCHAMYQGRFRTPSQLADLEALLAGTRAKVAWV